MYTNIKVMVINTAVAYEYLCPKVKNQNIKFIYVYVHTHIQREIYTQVYLYITYEGRLMERHRPVYSNSPV